MRCLTCVATIACVLFLPDERSVLAQQETERERERIVQWEQRMIQKRIANNHAVLDLLPAILDTSGFVQVAEMTDHQLEQARDLHQRLQREKASIIEESSAGEERRRKLVDMRTRFLAEFNEIFVPFQLEQMLRWTPKSGGLPKMLTETPVGTSLSNANRVRHALGHTSFEEGGDND